MERKIAPVLNNSDKAQTYKALMSKYRKAINNECYFEALLIVYAFLEDRLRSYLFYIGVLKTNQSHNFDNKKIKSCIKEIVEHYTGEENVKFSISNISGKTKIVRSVNQWYMDGCRNDDNNGYLNELAGSLDTIVDSEEMLSTLDLIKKWCDYRNEVIHAALNKNIDSLYSELGDRVEQGMEYGRIIDKQVRALKRKNSIRKYLKLK